MLISVVIPLYNKEKYILRTVESVLAQNYTNFELIIVDDGSTDKSAHFVETLSDARIQLVKQENGGVSKARNKGAKQAKGEWVAFLDADDEYSPDFLKETLNFLENHQGDELSFIGTNYFIGSANEMAINESIESGIYDYFDLFKNQRSPNNSSTTIVNKNIFFNVGGFPEGIKQFEDWITWFKLACVGNFGFVNLPLGLYHTVEGSVSFSKRESKDFFNDAIFLTKTIIQYINKNHLELSKKKNAIKCINDFSINMAAILATDGEKIMALKLFKYIRIFSLYGSIRKKFMYLLFHLFVPQYLKRVYWKLRWGK